MSKDFIGVARILSGVALFFLKKLTTFLVVASKDGLKLLIQAPIFLTQQKMS